MTLRIPSLITITLTIVTFRSTAFSLITALGAILSVIYAGCRHAKFHGKMMINDLNEEW